MATVGQKLLQPESGWRRYNDTDSRINYVNGFSISSNSVWGGGTSHTVAMNIQWSINFKFYGTKLRIFGATATNRPTKVNIKIDGVLQPQYSCYSPTTIYTALLFESSILSLGTHLVEIYREPTEYYEYDLDCIDIDDTGYLVHPTLNQVSSLIGMAVGDCIPCRYTAKTSGSVGYFSELGTCTADEIPVTGTATPDGLFYLVKVDKGKLIADRVLQTSISWDVLNSAKFIEGNLFNEASIKDGFLNGSYENDSLLVSASSERTSYSNYAWKVFDGVSSNGDSGAHAWISNSSNSWIKVQLKKSLDIKYIGITGVITTGSYIGSKDIIIEISIDDINYTSVYTGTLQCITLEQILPVNIPSDTKFIKITILNTYASNAGLNEIRFLKGNTLLIHSLSGGCAYADANGNKATVDSGKGAWPTNNEWDKYIVNSDLGGKITPGDDNIWHKILLCWTKDTSTTATFTSSTGIPLLSANTDRICRGANGIWHDFGIAISTTISGGIAGIGFRPVLEYIEQNSKQSNLWY